MLTTLKSMLKSAKSCGVHVTVSTYEELFLKARYTDCPWTEEHWNWDTLKPRYTYMDIYTI